MTPLILASQPASQRFETANERPTGSEFFHDANEFDIRFDVPQIQRLRFTDDVFQDDFAVLAALIEHLTKLISIAAATCS
mgnify:CR=1 FL=1